MPNLNLTNIHRASPKSVCAGVGLHLSRRLGHVVDKDRDHVESELEAAHKQLLEGDIPAAAWTLVAILPYFYNPAGETHAQLYRALLAAVQKL